MGSNVAQQGNDIARASLNESKRQFNEQQMEKERSKASARANAVGGRRSANMAYSNNFFQSTDFTTGLDGHAYNILTAGGTPSVIAQMEATLGKNSSVLG